MIKKYNLSEEISIDKEKELVAYCMKEYNKFKKYTENYLDKMNDYINSIPDAIEVINSLKDEYGNDISIDTTFKEFSDIVKYTIDCSHIYECIKEAESEYPLNMQREINELEAGKHSYYKSIKNAINGQENRKNKK